MDTKIYYFDNAATTRVDDVVAKEMMNTMINYYGNPSSLHDFGLTVEKKIAESRKNVANLLNVSAKEIFFTNSGTFANNVAIQGSITGNLQDEYITSTIEHSSVKNVYQKIKESKKVHFVDISSNGQIDIDQLLSKVNSNTRMVSIMHVNNELGSIQEIDKIGNSIKSINPKAIFHVDGIQGCGKISLDLLKSKVDIYTLSAHKIMGPKGIGAMFIRNGILVKPIIYGGGQERELSPGTENVPGIIGLGVAAKLRYENMQNDFNKVKQLKKKTIDGIRNIEGVKINSDIELSSPYILNICIKGIKSEVLLHMLEMDKIYISTGSACSKGKLSDVVKSLDLEKGYADGCIRISFSPYNTANEVEFLVNKLIQRVDELRKIMRCK